MDSVIQNNEEKLPDVMQLWAAPVGEWMKERTSALSASLGRISTAAAYT